MPHFFGTRSGEEVTIEGSDARHLAGPLRARRGETIAVADPSGQLLTVRLLEITALRVRGEVIAEQPHQPESAFSVWIALALLPATAFELALSACTQAGAAGFAPFTAARSVSRATDPSRLQPKLERWTAVAREAAMLAGRMIVPAVAAPGSLSHVVAEAVAAGRPPVALRQGEPERLTTTVQRLTASGSTGVTLLIGPEGGWEREELATAWPVASLGPRVMRAEVAALAAVSVALAAAGE